MLAEAMSKCRVCDRPQELCRRVVYALRGAENEHEHTLAEVECQLARVATGLERLCIVMEEVARGR